MSWLIILIISAQIGCGQIRDGVRPIWHQRFHWKADDYFDDPKVIALCEAIEANNLTEIERLITAGANVNAKGKGNMTPLLWAFPDNKLERFKCLLQHGADPNVLFKNDFGTHSALLPGEAVTHMVCETNFDGYFEAVFAHGGDPNLISDSVPKTHNTPIFDVIQGLANNKIEKVRTLIDKGADLNYINGASATPPIQAVSWGAQYDIALMLLQAGADYKIYAPMSNTRLIHIVAMEEDRKQAWTPHQAAGYKKLVDWLEQRGESLETAKADIKRWQSWSATTGEYRRKMDAEIAARKAKEASEKAAATSNQKKK